MPDRCELPAALSRRERERRFYVVLHDVTPRFAPQIEAVVGALVPLIGERIAAAYVPCWDGRNSSPDDRPFLEFVQNSFGEILLHGYTHRRENGRGLVSLLTRGDDEFNGLTDAETDSRLAGGQQAMQDLFGRPAEGFIAPTYQHGRLTSSRLARHGLTFDVGFRRIAFSSGEMIPIATWCWDMGRVRALGVGGHWYGNVRSRLHPGHLPTLAVHPVDVDRRFVPRIIALVERLLSEGRRPLLVSEASAARRTRPCGN